MRISSLLAALACAAPLLVQAVDVNVIGLFPGKAVVVVNRGAPRTLAVGERTAEGVLLVSADRAGAVIEFEGRRERLEMGQHFESASQTGARTAVTLAADSRGHFVADGAINGAHVRFLVDTGATYVSLPASQAARMGIDYRKGHKGYSQTANGVTVVYRVSLDSVTLGGLTLFNVEGVVHEGKGLDVALLGMSFLNRTELRRDGANLTLVKRY